jgi:predicted GNAT family N-acyltransferase
VLYINKLDKSHDRQSFDCGVDSLNHFIKSQASQLLKRHETVIYVAHDGAVVAGFYTLSACQITQDCDPTYLKKQSPYTPIPCVLLGRLAVDMRYRGMGLGGDLLLSALKKCVHLSDSLGVAFVVVDAKDDTAKAFYQYYGFHALQSDPMRLCLPISSITDK